MDGFAQVNGKVSIVRYSNGFGNHCIPIVCDNLISAGYEVKCHLRFRQWKVVTPKRPSAEHSYHTWQRACEVQRELEVVHESNGRLHAFISGSSIHKSNI